MAEKGILVVEDDKHISQLVKYNLLKAGYVCDVAVTGEMALEMLEVQSYDLIILDIMLPKMNGFEVCKKIKSDERFPNLLVIMLTAKGEEIDRVVGFELGADDYIVKPFSPRELVLRVKAMLRRVNSNVVFKENSQDVWTIKKLKVDIPRHRVMIGSRDISLTPMEFKLLLILIKRRGRVQSRDLLLEEVWEMNADVTTRTVDTHIKRLRQKLGSMGKYIETVRGHGYRLSEE